MKKVIERRRKKEEKDKIEFKKELRLIWEKKKDIVDYKRIKEWWEEYLLMKKREEKRGIGGIFYEWMN